MSRIQGNVGFISSYEIQNSSPLDARQWVPFLSDLTGATTFGSKYSGMTVSVYGDTASTENNGVYYYKGTNQTNINSWVKLLDTTYNFVDTYITGGTYSAGTLTLSNNTGGTLTVSGFSTTTQFTGGTVTGSTIFTNGLTANIISATTISGGTLYGNASNLTNFTSGQISTALGYTPQQPLNGFGVVYSNTGAISYIAGSSSQYVRGDGVLADFPSSAGGGGGSIYYFNGNVIETTISGNTYSQLSKTPSFSGGTSIFSATTNGDFAYFLTDVLSPDQTSIPAGVWMFEAFFSTNSTGSTPLITAKIYKYDGVNLIFVGQSQGENIDTGSVPDLHYFAASMTGTSLNITDRIAVVFNVTNIQSGKNLLLYTQSNTLSSVNTTFPVGIGALNGLTLGTQYFTVGSSGTTFNINSSADTHTFNIPQASVNGVTAGLISNTDYTNFNNKVAGSGTTNQIVYWSSNSGITSSNNLTFDGSNLNINGTLSATTYLNLPYDADNYLAISGGTVTGLTIFNGGFSASTDIGVNSITIGLGGGQKNTNIAIGLGSTFTANTTGSNNLAIGRNALVANTVGNSNTALGLQALQSSDSANYNTAIGAFSMYKYSGYTGSSYNTFIGYVAGGFGLNGYYNTGIGTYALAYASGTGTYFNVAIGANAGIYVQSGYSNTIIGNNAMYGTNSTTGNNGFGNTVIGDSSARAMLSGSKNTLIGLNAGRGIVTGSGNTIIGSYYGVNPMSNNVILSDGDGNATYQWNGTNNIFYGPISATTYQNLPLDIRVTGGTYTAGTITFTNNTGGTFTVSGFSTGTTAGGSNGQIQFNSNGNLSGNTYLTYDGIGNVNIGYTGSTGSTIYGKIGINKVAAVDGLDIGPRSLTATTSAIYLRGWVIGGGSTPNNQLIIESNNNNQSVRLTSVGNNQSYLGYGQGSGVIQSTANGSSGGIMAFIAQDNGGFQWTTNSASSGVLMTLKTGGNLLLGSTSDNGSKLQVSGNTNIFGSLTANTISATTYLNLPSSGGSFTGGTVSGATTFTNGLTANTFSATTITGGSLTLTSVLSGFVPNTLTETQRLALSPSLGTIVYQTNTTGSSNEGLYIYKSFGWIQII